ncbi:gephyrin-like molybdotransferase Glp [Polynucleobacter sp.]|uniref:molybdopterin molybdotransferase MoeA n=1 Tax=Polynucleobacter sp. TaxID=2029855 RepID=UPI002735D414|nr:gephyrin-like molybdotransferase Glp [Polynucleobacter sp.]MDP3122100.1 molybdopterin-binding protein [Polynucleobacter sp.]
MSSSPLSPNAPHLLSTGLTVEETRAAISDLVDQLLRTGVVAETESVSLDQGLNRVLASDVLSPIDVPAADNSAMDGFAFRGTELSSGPLTQLMVVGTVFAGTPFTGSLAAGQCLKIMTGALMPNQCDTVIPQEMTQKPPLAADGIERIQFESSAVSTGENRRLRGEDLAQGSVAIAAGRMLRPSDLGLAASLGINTLTVKRKLRVAILSSGNELRPLGAALDSGSIYDSNRYSLMGLLNRLGLDVLDCGIIQDDPLALKTAFTKAALTADVIISSGGVSVGEADFTKQVMQELGDVGFWKIAMRPGRPMAFGILKPVPNQHPPRSTLFFGLPGNPVAVMVTFYQFVQSALLQLSGATQLRPPLTQAIASAAIRKKPGRTEYQRGILEIGPDGRAQVRITGSQGAGILRSMSEANCFIVLGHEQGNIAAGDLVNVVLFEGLL